MTENVSERENATGRIIYDTFARSSYFSPILQQNHKALKTKLLPLCDRLNREAECRDFSNEKTVVFMVTADITFNMGLSDHLRGMTSVYKICKELGVTYRVFFKAPNQIDYLEPNEYDWRVDDADISYDISEVYPCTLLTLHANLNDTLNFGSVY